MADDDILYLNCLMVSQVQKFVRTQKKCMYFTSITLVKKKNTTRITKELLKQNWAQ